MLAKNSISLNEYNFESTNMRNDKIFTRFKKILKSISIFILLAIPLSGFAQYDYEHYVPPFYCSSQVGKQEVFLSTNSEKDINVYIEDGQGNPIAGPFTINRNQSKTYIFRTPGGATYSQHSNTSYPDGCSYSLGIIGPKELNKPLDGQGLRIYSYDGPFFANIRHGYSNSGEGGALTHGFSLSAKGAYAKGKEFYSGHLYSHTILNGDPLDYRINWWSDIYYDTKPIRSHSISVMAVEDGVTTVTFSGIKCKYITKYEGGKVVLKSIAPNETITVNLNKGQTYTLGTNLHSDQFGSESIEVRNGMNGTHITSTKDIVVNSGSWTAGAKPSQDIGFDQIVPVDQVRDKYIVMKGLGSAEPDPTAYHAGQERTIVVATQANTEVWVNEVLKGTLAEPGDFMILDDIVNPDDIPTLFINSKGKDVYVYQTMCGTSEDWINIGLNFIPPLTALGMKEVVIPKAEQITSGDYINPTVTVLAQKNVNVKHNGVTLTNPNDILGSTEWVYYKVSGISGDCRFTGDKAINVAWTASSNTLGAAGYYSGFTKAVSPIHPDLNIDTDLSLICESYDDDIIVSIKDNTGRDPDFYEWYKEIINSSGETEWEGPNFINSSLKIPAPNENTTWEVRAYYRDPSLEILFNGDFLDGYNGFDSYYELVTNNLVDPGQFAITGRPKDENPILNDFNPIGGWKMLLAYSKNQNDTIYRSAEMEVESGFNYIFKMYGRLAQSDATKNQSLKILINNETIVENFRIDRSDDWQSISALWRPNGARNASIKILNNNLNGEGTFFAIDSISFVQAVEDKDLFEAKVIPNYSYSNNGKTFQFCQGVENSLDVSNGDTSWYNYSWSKKSGENYVDLTDNAEYSGTDTYELTFLNPQETQEGVYRCTIGFKPEYQQCGTSESSVNVDLTVFVDEEATVSITPETPRICEGSTITLQALVSGTNTGVKWYVNEDPTPIWTSPDFIFPDTYPAGVYTIRCEAENGCGIASDEVSLEVLSAPRLTNLFVNSDLCAGDNIILSAEATGNGTLVYDWKEGTVNLAEHGAVLTIPATMDHRTSVFSVNVRSVYTVGSQTVECRSDDTETKTGLDIYPRVDFSDLVLATVCEGTANHTFSVNMPEEESYYDFFWYKDGTIQSNSTSSYIISPVNISDGGEYKVVVSNRCDSKESLANLTVTPKLVVNEINIDQTDPFCNPTNVTVTFTDNGAALKYVARNSAKGILIDPISNPYTFEINSANEGTWEFSAEGNCGSDPISKSFTLNMIPDFGVLSIADVGTCAGKTVDFVAEIDDIPTNSIITYAWKDNNNNLIGGNSEVLTLENVQETDLGSYSCTVTDQCGRTKTDVAVLTMEKVNTSSIASAIVKCVGDNFRIDIDYVGSPTFEWRFNNLISAPISTSDFYEIGSLATSDEGTYYCTITLTCGDKIVIQRNLTVNEHVSLANPADETIHICQGEKPLLEVDVNGNEADYTIQWTDELNNVIGSGSQIQLPAQNLPGNFTYKATVNGLCENPEKNYLIVVHQKPLVTTADNSLSECSGPITLSVTKGGENNGVVWWRDGVVITDGNAVDTDFVINSAVSPTNDGTYIARVSNDYCPDAQVSINLDVRNGVVITGQSPAIITKCENEATSLFVNATGDNLQFKWYKSSAAGVALSSNSVLNLGNIAKDQEGEYKCEVSNDLNCNNQTLTFNVVVNQNPTVTNPVSQTVCETQPSVDFTVVGTAVGTVTYQWYDKDNNPVVGATSATLTVSSLVNGQSYYCVVTGDACGSAISEKATLTVVKELAVTNPSNQTISDGADVTFKVTASGEPSYSYQWQVFNGSWTDLVDGGNYAGTKTSELKITHADKATFNGKQYRCKVTSSGGICDPEKISDPATLIVTSVVKIAIQPTDKEVCFGADAILSVGGIKSGLIYTWYYKKGAAAYETAVGKDGMSTSLAGNVSSLTVPATDMDINNWKFKCLVSDGVSTDVYTNEVSIKVLANISVTTLDGSFTPCLGEVFSLSVNATGDQVKYKWYKVGEESSTLSTSASLPFGNISLAREGVYKCEVYNDLHCNDVIRTFTVDVKEPATVSNPSDVTMCETDSNPTFTVIAGGNAPFTYQWYNSAGAIAGATSDTYTKVSPVDGQTYYCKVTNYCNTVSSLSADLVVIQPLAVTSPANLTIADGATAVFKVVASGEPNYSYQWEENSGSGWGIVSDGGKYSGATTATLTISGADQATFDGNQYRCIVTTDGTVCVPSVTSGTATLTINLVDKIFIQPSNDEVCFNEDAHLSVEGNVVGLNYVWSYDDNSGGGYVTVVAQAGMSISLDASGKVSTLTIPATDLDINNWKFKCTVDAGFTPEESNVVSVKVLQNIAIIPGVINFDLCQNESLLMSVSATGDNIKYKWYKDSAPATILSTNSSFGIGNVALTDTGTYTCEVYNDKNCNNEVVNFTVNVKELVTVSGLTDYEMCESAAAPTFTVSAGGDNPTYQWFDKSGAISGEISASYTVVTPVNGQSYYCEVSNSCNSVKSNAAVLSVLEEVVIVTEPIDNDIVDGANVEFTVSATGEPVITYQWEENMGFGWNAISDGGKYNGANTATLKITGVDKATFDGNQYRCVVDNGCSVAATSAEVSLTVNSLIKIATQPQDIQVCLSDAAQFVITGSNVAGLIYTWEYDNGSGYVPANGVSGMSAVATASGSELNIPAVTLAMESWSFRCIVRDGSSTDDISNTVSMKVFEPVSYDAIVDQNLCFGEGVQVGLNSLQGSSPLSYSWKKNGTEVSTTNLVNILAGDNGDYEITVGNGVCPDKTDLFTVSHYSELTLASWSNPTHVCIGGTEVLSVGILNSDPALSVTQEWFKDEVSIGTDPTFSLTATDKNQAGQYKIVVTDGCSTKSETGYLNIYQPILAENSWDTEVTLCVGEELKLETKISGDVTSHVWTKGALPLTANSTYLIPAVTLGDAGTYSCTVSGQCGTPISYTIDVKVLAVPSITTGIDALPEVCEGDALELGPISINGTYDAVLWTLNDNSINSTAGLSLNLGVAELSKEGNYKVTVSNVCGSDVSIGTQKVNPIPSLNPIDDQIVCQGEDVVFRANTTGRNLTYQWLVDGIDQAVNSPEFVIEGYKVLAADENTPQTYSIECRIESVDGCGDANESARLTVNPNTILKTTLKNVVRYVGEDYVMTVDAVGSDLSYTWTHEKDGVTTLLTEVTGPSIVFTNLTLADAGYYNCKIIGTCGQRLASGKLTIKEPVKIISGLKEFEQKCVGEPLSLYINATGQITSVFWYKKVDEVEVLLPNTDLNFFISELSLEDAGTYICKIKGEGIGELIEQVNVRVYPNTVLIAPLGNLTLCEGLELDWNPNVTGASDLEYSWTFKGAEIFDERVLHYDEIDLNKEGDYEVQVSGLCGNVSTNGKLNIIQLPVFVTASEGKEVCENTSLVEFSVEYIGENLKYQWRKNGIDIVGKTNPVLSLTSVQLDDDAVYDCKVYSTCATLFSPEVKLTVIPQLKIVTQPVDLEVCAGEEVHFNVVVEGNDVVYQWKRDGIQIDGATNSSLDISNAQPVQSGYYTCSLTDFCTTTVRSTKPAQLVVNQLPNTEIFGRMRLCAKEDRVTYTTIDQPEIIYDWGVNGGLFAGPEEGLRTRITWGEGPNGSLDIVITDLVTGCKAKIDSLVTLHALPTVTMNSMGSKGVCEKEFELYGGFPTGGIYWVDDISEEVFDPAAKGAGTYNVHYSYTDEYGCSNVTSKTTLRVDPLPTVNITDDTTIGSCKPFKLSAETEESNIQWSPADHLDDPTSMTPIYTPGESEVLNAIVVDEHGCIGIDLVNLTVAPLPIVTTISDTTVGQCNQLQLLTDIVGDAGEITWTNPDHLDDPNTRSPKIVNAPEGTYTYKISVTDLYGCDAEGEVIVNMVADPELEEDKFACEGEKFEVNIAGMENPIWEDGFTNIERTIDQPGKYLLTVKNEYGCGDEQNFVINPTPKPDLRNNLIYSEPGELEFVKDRPVTILEGQTVTLAPNLPLEYSPYYFEWEDGKEGSIFQRYEVSETGKYKLTVTDNLGCIAKDSVNVEVKPVGIESPNAFTPGSDNENSKFYLKDINYDIEKFEMYVYDRWGELLFKTNETGLNGGWDGTYKGKLCPAGAYVWVAFINGELTNKGTFVLVR